MDLASTVAVGGRLGASSVFSGRSQREIELCLNRPRCSPTLLVTPRTLVRAGALE